MLTTRRVLGGSLVLLSLAISVILVAVLFVTPTSAEDFDGDGDPDTVISVNTVFEAGEYTFGDLLITNGAVLTLSSNTSAEGFQGVRINAHCIKVDAGSAISAAGKGCAKDSGDGKGTSGAGAGYGGVGGSSMFGGNPGGVYGSATEPTDLGSGGGSYNVVGGSGGGAIRLDVSANLTIDGSISANGANGACDYGGGGSGGSIYITANTTLGTGSISANGGAGGWFWGIFYGGGGGGGRIAIYYVNDNYSGTISAYGGAGYQYGGAGTIFVKTSTQDYGDLLVDNNNHSGATTPLLPDVLQCDNVEVRNSARATVEAGSSLFTSSLGTSPEMQLGTLTNEGLVSATDLMKITFVNNGTLNSPDNSITIGAGATLEQNVAITLENLTIESGGVLTHSAEQSLNVTVTNDLAIETGGSITVSGKGCAADTGVEDGAGTSGAGAGYGGMGGAGAFGGDPGVVYGSPTEPTHLGSGGGSYNVVGGAGGGAIRLDVSGNLTIDGSISANGAKGADDYGGGGSGGSIYITADTILGTGSISANGGAGGNFWGIFYGGGGGGGRIAIYYVIDNYTGTISAQGGPGHQYGGAGTIVREVFAVWVDDDYGNPSPGTGTMDDPFHEIQMGIDALDGGLVHVAPGTYVENITLKNRVEVIGAGPTITTIDGGAVDSVVKATDLDSTAVLDGFTIANGDAEYGGGIKLVDSDAVIRNCVISGNSASSDGGGIYIDSGTPVVVNCIIVDNSAKRGGGIYDTAPPDGTCYPVFTNCTISGNGKGGLYNNPASGGVTDPTVTNCIIWGNSNYQIKNGIEGKITVNYCDIQGGYTGTGNIDADPLLTVDYHLGSGSPCVDVGSNSAPSLPDTDIDGEIRIYNDTVDMGADEFM